MKTNVIQPHKSSLGGVDANIIVSVTFILLAAVWWVPYLRYFAWIIPLVVFFLEKESKFVKFQACTAVAVGILRAAIELLLVILIRVITPSTPRNFSSLFNYSYNYMAALRRLEIAIFMYYASIFIAVVLTAFVALLVVMTFLYKQIKIPFIGMIAEKMSSKLENANINLQGNTLASNKTDSGNTPDSAIKPVFCGECGTKNDANTKFCCECGKPMA